MREEAKKSIVDKLRKTHEKLRRSDTKEFIDVVINDGNIKVSVGSRLKRENELEDFIEIVIDLSSIESIDEIVFLDRIRSFIVDLDKKGFEKTSDQDGLISYEQKIELENIGDELSKLENSVHEKLQR